MDFKFGTVSIFDIGHKISEELEDYGVTQKAELTVYLGEEEFKKVDEDLFYRLNKEKDEKFVPSEGEIDINFKGVIIKIKEKKV
jgi:hypothetical protein